MQLKMRFTFTRYGLKLGI